MSYARAAQRLAIAQGNDTSPYAAARAASSKTDFTLLQAHLEPVAERPQRRDALCCHGIRARPTSTIFIAARFAVRTMDAIARMPELFISVTSETSIVSGSAPAPSATVMGANRRSYASTPSAYSDTSN